LIEVATVGKRFVAVLAVSMGMLSGGSTALAGVNAASALPAAQVAAAPKPFEGEPPRLIDPSSPESGVTADKVAPPLPIVPVTAPATPSPTYPESASPIPTAPIASPTVPAITRPVFDPAKSVEAPELRTATRTVFKRNDGTFEVHEATNAVNFQDGKGVWQQIDNHLVADGTGGFKNKANSFTVSFKPMRPGGGVSIKAPDGEIRFVADGADPSVKPVLSADGLSVTYPNVLPGSDLVYRATGEGFEDNLMVNSPSSVSTVRFAVSGSGLRKGSNGLSGGGTGLAGRVRISRPDSFDAKGHAVDANRHVFEATDDATGSKVPEPPETDGRPSPGAPVSSSATHVSFGLEPAFVKTLPADAFPVKVDPSVSVMIGTDVLQSWAYHTSNCAPYASFNDTTARIGNPNIGGSNADVVWQSVLHFNFSAYVGANVQDAFLATNVTGGATSGTQPLNAYWARVYGTHCGGTTPNNTPAPSTATGWTPAASGTISTGLVNILGENGAPGLKTLFDPWVRTGNTAAAMLLTTAETGYTAKLFTVSLVLVLNRWPQATGGTAVAGTGLGHNVVFTASGSDPEGELYAGASLTDPSNGNYIDNGWNVFAPGAPSRTTTINAPVTMAGKTVNWVSNIYDGFIDGYLNEAHVVQAGTGTVTVPNTLPAAATPTGPPPSPPAVPTHSASQTLIASLPQKLDIDGDQVYYRFFYCTDAPVCSNKAYLNSAGYTQVAAAGQVVSQAVDFQITPGLSSQSFFWGVATQDGTPAAPVFSALSQITISNQAPTAALVSPVNNAIVSTQLPTLTAQIADPDDTQVSYRFVLAPQSGSGILASQPWTSATVTPSGVQVSWTPPEGLVSGAGYNWRVEVKDITGLLGNSSTWLLTPTGRLGADSTSPMQSIGGASVNLATGNLFFTVPPAKSIATVGGNAGVSMSYNSQDRSKRGLRGQYWVDNPPANGVLDAGEISLTRIDPLVSFNWVDKSPGELGSNDFRAKWTGFMRLPSAGAGNHTWVFGGGHDENMKVTVNGTTVVYDSPTAVSLGDPTAAPFVGSTPIVLGDGALVPITIDYTDTTGNAFIELRAKVDGTERILTDGMFSPGPTDLPLGWTLSVDNGLSAAWSSVAVLSDGVSATQADGSQTFFTKTTNPTSGLSAWKPPAGTDDVLVVNPNGTVTIHGDDGLDYQFDNTGTFASVSTAADDLKPAGAQTTMSPGTDTKAPIRVTALTDRLAASRTIKLSYQQAGLFPTSGACPVLPGFDTPPAGMLCQIDYPDNTQTRLYYQGGMLSRISDPGDETATIPATSVAAEGRAVTDLTWTAGVLTTVFSAAANDRARAQTATPAVFGTANTMSTAELSLTIATDTTTGKVTSATLPAPAKGAAASTTSIGYPVPLNPLTGGTTTVGLTGITGTARTVMFDGAGRTTSDMDAIGRTKTTQWSPGLDVVLWSTADGRTTSTIYDKGWHPLDAYGPAPTACFAFPSPIIQTTNGATPALANSGCVAAGVTQIPHTKTDYDTDLSGLTGVMFPTKGFDGATVAHRKGPGSTVEYNDTQAAYPNGWSIRYTGLINPPAAGNYTITLNTAGATSATLYINDVAQANKLAPGQSTSISFGVVDTGPLRVRLDVSTTTATENVSLWWTTPWNATSTPIPNVITTPIPNVITPFTVVKPGFFYPTKTTTDETSGSSQVPATSVSSQRYDQGIDPSYGIVTSKTVDPNGLVLSTATAPEPATPGSLLRQVSRTLPAYAATPTTANSVTYSYFAAGVTASNGAATATNVSTLCLGAAAIDQGQRTRFNQSPTPGTGAAISMEVVYDMLGRAVGSRYVGDSTWECTNYDTRGRVMTVSVPAFGASPARTKTNAYMVGGDPSVSTVSDNSVTGSTNTSTVTTRTDFLGRAIEVTDVWGIKTTTVFDVAGRVISSSSPGGIVTSTYDDANRLVTQSIDGQPVATLTYNPVDPVTNPLDGGSMRGISYPTGGGNGTSLAPITRDVLGRTTSLDWRQANGTALTKDTVTRALSGRVLTDTIDANPTPAWSYSYDGAGRLTAANGSGHAYNYGYGTQAACNGTTGSQSSAGANGNRTSVTDNGSLVSYGCYDQADRLLTSNTTTSTPGGMSLAVGYTAAGAGIALRKTGTPLVPITPVAGQGTFTRQRNG
jgi:PA14 domain